MNDKRPILITGSGGFIGRHLVERLLQEDETTKIILLKRSPSQAFPNEWSKAADRLEEVIIPGMDITSLFDTMKSKDFGAIINLAAAGVSPSDREPAQLVYTNTLFPVSLIELAKSRDAAFISTGSVAEYQSRDDVPYLSETAPLENTKLYGASKASCFLLGSAVATQLNLRYLHLRLFNVYGAGEAGHRLLPSLVKGLQSNQRVPLSTGEQIRDFVHVSDVCEAYVHALNFLQLNDAPIAEAVNIATGTGMSVKDYAKGVADILGASQDLLGFGDIAMRPDDSTRQTGKPARAKQLIDWQAALTLYAGLRKTLAVEQLLTEY